MDGKEGVGFGFGMGGSRTCPDYIVEILTTGEGEVKILRHILSNMG